MTMEYKCQNKECEHKTEKKSIIYWEPEVREWWCEWCNSKMLKKCRTTNTRKK